MKKILFYYHHFGGAGHGTRIYSLCKAISKLFPSYRLYVLNSGHPQPELNIRDYARVINLPPFGPGRGLFSGLYSSEGVARAFQKRRRILKISAAEIKPDLVFLEHYPFGRYALALEINEFANELRRSGALVYSSVRDIIVGRPDHPCMRSAAEILTGIFAHSSKEMGLSCVFRIPRFLKDKIVFTGRVFPLDKDDRLLGRKDIIRLLGCKGKKLILISIGGGIDGLPVIDKMLRIKSAVDKEVHAYYLISAGASVSDTVYSELEKRVRGYKDVSLRKYIPDYLSYVLACDLYVAMGGYNSVNNIIFSGVKNIIFPRCADIEQVKRAGYYSRAVNKAGMDIPLRDLSVKVIRLLKQKRRLVRNEAALGGAKVTARLAERIFNLDYIKIRLTTACNCSCDMCSWKKRGEELDLPRLKKVLNEAKFLNVKTVNFTGGEPTLYRHFPELMKYAKALGFCISVSTNGVIAKTRLGYLAKYADYIDISLNSASAEKDDRIRGRKGAFARSLSSLRYLNSVNRRICLHINVTVRPDNFRGIHHMVRFLSPFARSISFTLVDTTINRLGYLVFSRKELLNFYAEEVPLIISSSMRTKTNIRITPFFTATQFLDKCELGGILKDRPGYLEKIKEIFLPPPERQCGKALNSLRINADGEISPCCYMDDYPLFLGNINKNDLTEIVSSDKYCDFLKNAYPGAGLCKRCMSGYGRYKAYFK